jgi:hypothetical protein
MAPSAPIEQAVPIELAELAEIDSLALDIDALVESTEAMTVNDGSPAKDKKNKICPKLETRAMTQFYIIIKKTPEWQKVLALIRKLGLNPFNMALQRKISDLMYKKLMEGEDPSDKGGKLFYRRLAETTGKSSPTSSTSTTETKSDDDVDSASAEPAAPAEVAAPAKAVAKASKAPKAPAKAVAAPAEAVVVAPAPKPKRPKRGATAPAEPAEDVVMDG